MEQIVEQRVAGEIKRIENNKSRQNSFSSIKQAVFVLSFYTRQSESWFFFFFYKYLHTFWKRKPKEFHLDKYSDPLLSILCSVLDVRIFLTFFIFQAWLRSWERLPKIVDSIWPQSVGGHSDTGPTELTQREHCVLCHVSAFLTIAQFAHIASSRKNPGSSKCNSFLEWRGHCAFGNLQCSICLQSHN